MRTQAQLVVMVGFFVAVFAILSGAPVLARWKPQFSNRPAFIQRWYATQHNAQGQWCCDKSDGHPFYGAYTMNHDGSVTLHLKSGERKLPAYMVLKGPNPTGHAVWWFVGVGDGHVDFCFAPGTLT